MCRDTPSTEWNSALGQLVPMRPEVAKRIAELEAEVALPSVFDLATLRLRDQAEISRLTEQVDLYRVKHAELEAVIARYRAAASPVAVKPGEVRT